MAVRQANRYGLISLILYKCAFAFPFPISIFFFTSPGVTNTPSLIMALKLTLRPCPTRSSYITLPLTLPWRACADHKHQRDHHEEPVVGQVQLKILTATCPNPSPTAPGPDPIPTLSPDCWPMSILGPSPNLNPIPNPNLNPNPVGHSTVARVHSEALAAPCV